MQAVTCYRLIFLYNLSRSLTRQDLNIIIIYNRAYLQRSAFHTIPHKSRNGGVAVMKTSTDPKVDRRRPAAAEVKQPTMKIQKNKDKIL